MPRTLKNKIKKCNATISLFTFVGVRFRTKVATNSADIPINTIRFATMFGIDFCTIRFFVNKMKKKKAKTL